MAATRQGWPLWTKLAAGYRRQISRHSMAWTITPPFLLLLLLSVVSVGHLILRHSVWATRDLAKDLGREDGDRTIAQLEDWLAKPGILNQLNQHAVQQGHLDLSKPETIRHQFLVQLEAFPDVVQLMAVDAQGRSVTLKREAQTGSISNTPVPDGLASNAQSSDSQSLGPGAISENTQYDNRKQVPDQYRLHQFTDPTQPGQEIVLNSSGAVLSRRAIMPSDLRGTSWYQATQIEEDRIWEKQLERGIAIAARPIPPVHPETTPPIVVAAAVDLSQLDAAINELKLTEHGQIFVLDETGLLLSTSTLEVPYRINAEGQVAGMLGRSSRNDITRATVAYLHDPQVWSQISTEQSRFFELPFAGDRLFIQARRHRPYPGADWLIAAVIPKSDVLGPIRSRQSQTVALAGGFLLLSLGLCIVIAQHLVRPVRSLSRAAEAIAQGQWQSALPTHRRDELGDLAQAFSRMSQALQQSFLRLADQNQQLEQQNQTLIEQAEHLQALDQLKDEFLANTSHELRTPLSGILGLAESLQVQPHEPLSPKQAEVVGLITASAHRLSMLVNDILDLSCLDHRVLKLNLTEINLYSLVEHVLALCAPLAQSKQLSLINETSPHLPAVYADSHRVQQILYNLVGNSIKFTHQGSITVSAAPIPSPQPSHCCCQKEHKSFTNYVAITVADTGIGMSSDLQSRIFTAFEQGSGETTRRYGGTGLGLAVSKALVELHGGTIQVRSQPGQGSQFCFTLPLLSIAQRLADQVKSSNPTLSTVPSAQSEPFPETPSPTPSPTLSQTAFHAPLRTTAKRLPQPSQPAALAALQSPAAIYPQPKPFRASNQQTTSNLLTPNQRASSQPTKARILIVDDDPTNLVVLREQLRSAGYDTVQAMTGQQALLLLNTTTSSGSRSEAFDLVILDVMMPLMSGYEVCRRLRQQHPIYQLPVIMLTAKVQAQDVVEGFRAGANDYLKKPFSRDELLSRTETHLSNSFYGRFVPEHFLRFLQKSTITDIHLGNQISCDMTVMFSDIRGFATLSELMTPQENFDFINAYLQRVSPEIRNHGGFIVKYLGDGMMAIFPQRAEDAIAAALAQLHQVHQFNRDRGSQSSIQIGIGIHHGPMKVGIIGEDRRMQCDAFSDNVNLTARLEGLTKFYGVPMLISEQALQQLSPDHGYAMRYLDQVRVKGRVQSFGIYEVLDADQPTLDGPTCQQFEAGVQAYQAADFTTAQLHFQAILAASPHDQPTQLYCDRIKKQLHQPPTSGWTGIHNWPRK